MSWIIQCPNHGKVIRDYRYEGMKELVRHSKEEKVFSESCLLYEDDEQ